tara:strand:+ start:770 stop:886 length:117 start_codon:yes stop_codon:yes gene_type:complete
MIKDITFETFTEKVFDINEGNIVNKSDKPVLVKFYADW